MSSCRATSRSNLRERKKKHEENVGHFLEERLNKKSYEKARKRREGAEEYGSKSGT